MHDPVVIVGAARTPMGAFQGDFSNVTASDLGAVAIRAAVERSGVAPDAVEHVFFGNCLHYPRFIFFIGNAVPNITAFQHFYVSFPNLYHIIHREWQ